VTGLAQTTALNGIPFASTPSLTPNGFVPTYATDYQRASLGFILGLVIPLGIIIIVVVIAYKFYNKRSSIRNDETNAVVM
jgi:uncharacterized membrane protein